MTHLVTIDQRQEFLLSKSQYRTLLFPLKCFCFVSFFPVNFEILSHILFHVPGYIPQCPAEICSVLLGAFMICLVVISRVKAKPLIKSSHYFGKPTSLFPFIRMNNQELALSIFVALECALLPLRDPVNLENTYATAQHLRCVSLPTVPIDSPLGQTFWRCFWFHFVFNICHLMSSLEKQLENRVKKTIWKVVSIPWVLVLDPWGWCSYSWHGVLSMCLFLRLIASFGWGMQFEKVLVRREGV